jgi:antitoxin (DNA-binding transcriptional repressor) of toxin-antitoxin stability system
MWRRPYSHPAAAALRTSASAGNGVLSPMPNFIHRSDQMKEFGIRQAKARLSQIVRAAADGEYSLVTDNRKPVAMIGPLSGHGVEAGIPPRPAEETKPLSDAAAFRKALLSAPFPLDLDF